MRYVNLASVNTNKSSYDKSSYVMYGKYFVSQVLNLNKKRRSMILVI